MKKLEYFKIFWHYVKNDKLKLFMYILLVVLLYLPSLLSVFFWGEAIEALTHYDFNKFLMFLVLYESIYIILYAFLQIPKDRLFTDLQIIFTKNVSKDLYRKIDSLPQIAFEDMGVGEFVNRLYTDPERIMELLEKMIRLICKAIVVVIVLVISFKVSFILGMEVVLLGIIMGFISGKFFPKIKKSNENIKKESDQYVKIATENITGIREIKSLGITKNIENKVFQVLDKLYNHVSHISVYERWYYGFNNLAYFVLQFIIFLTCGKLYVTHVISLSIFMMMETYIWKIDEVVESISDFGVSFNKVSVSLKRIDEILNNKLYQDEKYGDIVLNNSKGVITFRDVKFKYRKDEDYTLKGLNLEILPNKKVAIVGRSGNGKSTIFNLLLRYFDVTEGSILIDGENILDLTEESLRKNISVIRQSPFLFNLSIIDNFRLVKEEVTKEEVERVCKKAYIHDYIMSLPKGYDTVIGEGGVNLSGGQKQRIAIARTLLLNTKIILFDEATSALDNESQEYIKKTIDELVCDHTIIIVAHRLSTIVDADVICVIDKGRLAGLGKHDELLKTNEVYQKLYENENV